MKPATSIRTVIAAAVLLTWAGAALAQVVAEPVGDFAGWFVHDYATQTTTPQPNAPQAVPVVVYDNTTSRITFVLWSNDLASVWGDRLVTTNVGTLSAVMFSVYNAGTSAGPMYGAIFQVDFYDANTAAPLGNFTSHIVFGGGLQPGSLAFVTVTSLDLLQINLNTSDLIVTQQVVDRFGPASRLGIVSYNPVTVGSSLANMYIASTTFGPPGWYLNGDGPANPGWQVSVVTAPVPTGKSSWGAIKNLYR